MLLGDDVVHRQPVHVAAHPARPGRPDTQHGDDISSIGMREQRLAVAIRPFIAVEIRTVGHPPQSISHNALGLRFAEMGADAPVHHTEIVLAQLIHGKSADHDHAPAVENLVAQVGQVVRHVRQGEVITCDVVEPQALLPHVSKVLV